MGICKKERERKSRENALRRTWTCATKRGDRIKKIIAKVQFLEIWYF
jgi:hypothetical protein